MGHTVRLMEERCQAERRADELSDCSSLDRRWLWTQDVARPARFSGGTLEVAEISRVSVADQVAGILRQRILNGELPPGTALQEIPTAASLGVSRNTVREATRILSLEGLLKRSALEGYERAVAEADWVCAVRVDLQFHTLLIRFQRNRRLESFYQKLIGELRMGM